MVVLAIDERTLAEVDLRVFDWPRRLHAQAIDNLVEAGAGVLVYDVLFAESSEDDDELARGDCGGGKRDPAGGRGRAGGVRGSDGGIRGAAGSGRGVHVQRICHLARGVHIYRAGRRSRQPADRPGQQGEARSPDGGGWSGESVSSDGGGGSDGASAPVAAITAECEQRLDENSAGRAESRRAGKQCAADANQLHRRSGGDSAGVVHRRDQRGVRTGRGGGQTGVRGSDGDGGGRHQIDPDGGGDAGGGGARQRCGHDPAVALPARPGSDHNAGHHAPPSRSSSASRCRFCR